MPQTRRPDGLLHFITARLKIHPLTGKSEEGGIWSFLLNMTGKSKKVDVGVWACKMSDQSPLSHCEASHLVNVSSSLYCGGEGGATYMGGTV